MNIIGITAGSGDELISKVTQAVKKFISKTSKEFISVRFFDKNTLMCVVADANETNFRYFTVTNNAVMKEIE